jgi:hypothetical protein
VLTIDGICQQNSDKPHECKTLVTRAQFEKLLSVLPLDRGQQEQPMSATAKRQFAIQYSHLLVFAAEAEKRGLQNTPESRLLLEYSHAQTMAQLMAQHLKELTRPTIEQAKDFYAANQDLYAELTLQRVYIPVQQLTDGKTNEVEMRAVADDLYRRAATAVEFSGLQAEANEKAGIKNPPQPTIVVPTSALPIGLQSVRQLKSGELSQIIQDSSGFYFYKLESKRLLAFEAAAAEIQEKLVELNLQQEITRLLSSAKPVLNAQYFQQSAVPPRHPRKTMMSSPGMHPAMPVSATPSN